MAAAAGCALLLGGAGARAQATAPDLFGAFKRVCADNAGVYSRTTAAPDVQSWSKFALPLPIPTGEARLSRKTIRAKALGGGAFGMFFAGEGALKSPDRSLPFQMCAIAVKPAELGAAVRQVQAWTGEAPTATAKGVSSFRHHLAADGRRTALGPGKLSDITAGLGPGTVVSIDVALQRGATMISYSTLKL